MSNKEILERLENDIKLRGLCKNTLEEYVTESVFSCLISNALWSSLVKMILRSFCRIYSYIRLKQYDEHEFVNRGDHQKIELRALEEEATIIQLSLNNLNNKASPEKLNLLKISSEMIQAEELTNEDLNALYNSIIKAIYFIRDAEDNVNLDIEYK